MWLRKTTLEEFNNVFHCENKMPAEWCLHSCQHWMLSHIHTKCQPTAFITDKNAVNSCQYCMRPFNEILSYNSNQLVINPSASHAVKQTMVTAQHSPPFSNAMKVSRHCGALQELVPQITTAQHVRIPSELCILSTKAPPYNHPSYIHPTCNSSTVKYHKIPSFPHYWKF